MKNISDYDFSRISAFVDGELETNEVYSLIADMQTKPELKDLYFNLLELSEVSVNLKPLGFKAKQILENIKTDEILQFASRHFVPDTSRNIVPVAYQPNWLPRGFNSDRKIQNRFINKIDKKQFSIFIDKPKNFNLPDGVYQKENFILIRKTHSHGDQPLTVTIFGDIDVESGKKILNSIKTNN